MEYVASKVQRDTGNMNCRICEGNVKEVGTLGNHFINDFPKEWPYNGIKCPLKLVFCDKCSLLQLKHTAPFQKLYTEHYWYKSGINKKIVDDLRDIAKVAVKEIKSSTGGDVWIDVGANDGTLLAFVPSSFWKVGVEPAKNLQAELQGKCDKVFGDFWENVNYIPAKVITAIGMFYDSENPNLFISKVKNHLADDGVFIAQMMTLKPMIENNDVGNICHEHLEFYSYKSLKILFERNGLEIYKIQENDINGGSYRLFARHFRRGSISHTEPTYDFRKFFRRIADNKEQLVSFIKYKVSKGKKVYCYGASTKGNTILQYYGLGADLISGVADANTEKIGLYMLTGIPIVSEEEAREKADYFFILPWGFTDIFLRREKEWRMKGGKFIVSIPNFKVI